MAGKRIPVLDPEGAFGTIPEEELDQLPEGARVLSRQEEAQHAVDERYASLPTAAKVAGAVNTVTGLVTPGGALTLGSDPNAPPEVAAYGHGVSEGLTGGLLDAGIRKGIDAVGGEAVGDRYAQQINDAREASPVAHGIGTTAGMLAGTALGGETRAARALPSAGISAAGAPIEAVVERNLAGLAAKGALGRATTTAAATAARGAFEGAAFSGIDQVANNVLNNRPTGEKLYAAVGHGAIAGGGLGAILGFGGSLGVSGARAASARIARAFGRGGDAVAEAAGELAAQEVAGVPSAERSRLLPGKRAVSEAGAPVEAGPPVKEAPAAAPPRTGGIMDALHDPTNAARGVAQDQAWSAVAAGFGLQTTRYAKQAAKYLPNGTRDAGEIAIRYGIVDMGDQAATPLQAAMAAAKSGTPAEMLPRITAARDSVGQQIGEITEASGARIHQDELRKAFKSVRDPLDKIAGNEHVVDAIDRYAESLGTKLRTAPDGSIGVQDLLEQRKGLDRIVFQETKTMDPGRRVEALRDIRGKLEDIIEEAMDAASGKATGELRAKYKSLKRDYTGLSILEEAAEDSAARASKHATFGLTDKIVGGAASTVGGLIGGAPGALLAAGISSVGSKVIRERGNAAAAAFLTRAADSGLIESAVARFNARVKSSAAGVLRESAEAPRARAKQSPSREAVSREEAREKVYEKRKQAQAIVKWVSDARANPARIMDQVQEASAIVGRAAGPQAAESYTAATMRAIAFISGHIPIRERRDPLDPKSVPPMTFDEADRLIRAATYATRPETVYDDFRRGIITPEGLRAATTFTPDDFKEFQLELQQHATNHLLKGHMLTQSQRLRLDKLLPYPAGSDFKQQNIARLQANLMKAPPEPTPADPTSGGGGPPPPPVDLKVQQSGFDRIEARLAG